MNQTCKYCIFKSYLWIVLYRLRLATKKKLEKQKQQNDNSNSEKKSHVVLYLHSSLVLLVNECVTLFQSNTQNSVHNTHRKRNAIKLGRGCRL